MNNIAIRALAGTALIAFAGAFASASRVDEEPIQCAKIAIAETGAEARAAGVLLAALGYKPTLQGGDAAALAAGDLDLRIAEDGTVASRPGYGDECKNVIKLLKNMRFPDNASAGIGETEASARDWLKANPDLVGQWLKGVKHWDGKTEGTKAVARNL